MLTKSSSGAPDWLAFTRMTSYANRFDMVLPGWRQACFSVLQEVLPTYSKGGQKLQQLLQRMWRIWTIPSCLNRCSVWVCSHSGLHLPCVTTGFFIFKDTSNFIYWGNSYNHNMSFLGPFMDLHTFSCPTIDSLTSRCLICGCHWAWKAWLFF